MAAKNRSHLSHETLIDRDHWESANERSTAASHSHSLNRTDHSNNGRTISMLPKSAKNRQCNVTADQMQKTPLTNWEMLLSKHGLGSRLPKKLAILISRH